MARSDSTTRDAAAVYRRIARFIARNGHAPTVRELAHETGLAVSTVQRRLTELEELGRIERSYGTARSIVLRHRGGDLRDDLAALARDFELAASHQLEFLEGNEKINIAFEHAIRAASFQGFANGIWRAIEEISARGQRP